jgi:tetratricopeptide (TPR) repeat protein
MLSLEVLREAGEHWWYLLSLINLGRTYLRLGKLAEVETIYHEAFQRLDLGDMRLVLPLRIEFAYARYLQNDHTRAEQLMQENLKLCYEYENNRLTALTYIDLSQVALTTHRVELAENYLQESVRLFSGMVKSVDLAIAFLYIGKCEMACLNLEGARAQFRQVIKIGHKLDTFYLVYWGLVNIARTYMIEGQPEKALEIVHLIRRCPVEYKLAQDEGNALLADLQATLPEGEIEAAAQQIEGELPADQAKANVLAIALEFERE